MQPPLAREMHPQLGNASSADDSPGCAGSGEQHVVPPCPEDEEQLGAECMRSSRWHNNSSVERPCFELNVTSCMSMAVGVGQ